ncbi:MAG: hypothetical protein AB2687_22680 [Candidatus Thiodiazotropha taylori]
MPKITKTDLEKLTSAILSEGAFGEDPNVETPTQIWGWRPKDKEVFDSLNLPPTPEGHSWVIGALSHEWLHGECESTQVYLVPDDLYIKPTGHDCYNRKVEAFAVDERIVQRVSGYQALVERTGGDDIERAEHEKGSEHLAASDQPSTLPLEGDLESILSGSLSRAFSLYTNSCTCGRRYSDNCAHFLSNALIRAGYTMGSGAKCSHGRLIRAKELLRWAQSRPGRTYRNNHNNPTITSGYWVVYQERSDGQGHVCLHQEKPRTYSWRGTGDYDSWPVQWHYKF